MYIAYYVFSLLVVIGLFAQIIDLYVVTTYRVAQKSKPLPNDQKIVLKPVIEIRLSRQIKV